MSLQRKVNNLREGQWIKHRALQVDGSFVDREGMVLSVLSAQFSYETEDGHIWMCLYSEDWDHAKGELSWLA